MQRLVLSLLALASSLALPTAGRAQDATHAPAAPQQMLPAHQPATTQQSSSQAAQAQASPSQPAAPRQAVPSGPVPAPGPSAVPDQAPQGQASEAAAQQADQARQRAEDALRAELAREQALRGQVAELQQQVQALTRDLDSTRARLSQLEHVTAAAEQDRAAAALDPAVRASQLQDTTGALAQAQSALATGSSSDVQGQLAQARNLLADVNQRASTRASGTEAALAAGAASDLDIAAEALQRSSIWEARAAIARATVRAQQALGIASGGQVQPVQAQQPQPMGSYGGY